MKYTFELDFHGSKVMKRDEHGQTTTYVHADEFVKIDFHEAALAAKDAEIERVKAQLHEANERLVTKTVEANGYHQAMLDAQSNPVDMLLFCPRCRVQHVDAPDERTPDWKNPAHKSHLCHSCGHVWRQCDRPTNGVPAIATAGSKDGSAIPSPHPDTARLDKLPACFHMLRKTYCGPQFTVRWHLTYDDHKSYATVREAIDAHVEPGAQP